MVDYYSGIGYKKEGSDLRYGLYGYKLPYDASRVNRIKKTYIGSSFAVHYMEFDNTPRANVSLSHDAFLKFRLACFRTEQSLKKLVKKVKIRVF